MLKEAEIQGSIELQTEKMGDCDLKSIYENESVKFSDVHFLMRGKIDEFVLFDKAYDEVGVRRLFEIGCPYEVPSSFGSTTP